MTIDTGRLRIYVASSWRNNYQQGVVAELRKAGHEVYDFKNPREGDNGFHWSEIDKDWKAWSPAAYMQALTHPIAEAGFESDFDAMRWADACVLVLPCGRSAHLEAGWFCGAGLPTLVYIPEPTEPELMNKLAHSVHTSINSVVATLAMLAEKLRIEGGGK